MNTINVNNPIDYNSYPANRMCAIVDKEEDARNTLDLLLRSNIQEDDIDIFHGDKDNLFSQDGAEQHGVIASIKKMLRSYGDMENESMHNYEAAIHNGGYVFEVMAKTDEEKEAVFRIFANNNARSINYFGSWYVEAMKEA
jgi:hypothetical protein